MYKNVYHIPHQAEFFFVVITLLFSPDGVINLGKKELTTKEKEILRFGLDNHILPKKLKVDDIKFSVERVLYALKTKLTEICT